jgi:hypothetical protein
MKKLLIAMAIASASLTASAAGVTAGVATVTGGTPYVVCDGGPGGGKTDVWGGPGEVVAGGTFTVAGFAIQCSNNVHMSINEVSTTLAVVGSASAKGNQYFGGHTNGGSVTAMGKCAADPCGTADVSTALTDAETAGSSS